MSSTKRLLIATGAAALTFALLYFACHQVHALMGLPRGFGLIPFFLLLPAEVLAEALSSRPVFLITGFLEFFLLWWLALGCWEWMQPRKRS